jgi:hypothetical protein
VKEKIMKTWNKRNNPMPALLLAAACVLIPKAVVAGDSGYSGGSWSDSEKTSTVASADKGYIKIIAPQSGAELSSEHGDELKYDVQLSPDGNHLHVYVDDNRPIIDHQVSGCPCSITLPTLSPGQHTVAVKEATKSHHLTGVMSSVTFSVK